MKYFKKLIGERLYLSPINTDDYEIYTKWINDYNVAKGINQVSKIVSITSEREYLESCAKEKYNFAIVLLQEDRLLGNISLSIKSEVDRTAVLGIFIGEESDKGKGYGTEAIRVLLDYGFNQLNLNNIMLKVYSFNKRAIRAYEKVGFKEFGIWKESHYFEGSYCDEIFMQILKKDFNKKAQ